MRHGRHSVAAILALALLAACQTTGGGGGGATSAAAPAMGDHQVFLLPDGHTVRFHSDVTYGATHTLLRLIRDNPAVDTVELISDGGYIGPAMIVANTLQLRGATTFVEDHCESACTILFLGGKRRVIAAGAQMGFHRAYLDVNKPDGPSTLATNRRVWERLVERGVAEDFADQVLATPGKDMWYPSSQEMVAAGVVTEVLPKGARP